jgi:tRNA uridine 5-carboxymethylaminomethyl modification enzyme
VADTRADTLYDLIRVDGLDCAAVRKMADLRDVPAVIIDELIEDARYAPYVARQESEVRAMRASDRVALSALDYRAIAGLSNEMLERLEAARPATLGAAERVRGITPAALAAILVAAKRIAA